MTRALIIADPQRDFCEGGSLGVAGGAAAVNRIDRLLKSDHGYAQVIASCDHHIDPGGHSPPSQTSWTPGHHTVWSAQRALSFMTTSPTVTSPPSSTRATTRPPTRPSRAYLTAAVAPERVVEVSAELAAAGVAIRA